MRLRLELRWRHASSKSRFGPGPLFRPRALRRRPPPVRRGFGYFSAPQPRALVVPAHFRRAPALSFWGLGFSIFDCKTPVCNAELTFQIIPITILVYCLVG